MDEVVLMEQRKAFSTGYMWDGLGKPSLRYWEFYRKDGRPNKARSRYFIDGERVTREKFIEAGATLPTGG